jgi:ATP-dependent helicase HrpB
LRSLPIDPLLAEITSVVREQGQLVLEAPPGAGKTTRVPFALIEALGPPGQILVTEPRRLAARLAAKRVADERGLRLGDAVGYSVRFEEVGGVNTRLSYVTEGVLVRRLLGDPMLRGVRAVVLDEVHERHLDTDLLLALLARLRRERRPDLALVVMSATLDAEPFARFLGDAPRLRSEGRVFAVSIEHLTQVDDRPLEKQVASAVRRVTEEEPTGDVLVFLPGAAEIRRASEALETLARERGLLVLPLHGDLPIAEQARAVEPAKARKVVLSTNVAESSLTIEGVVAVVDSGLARVAGHSAWTGLPTLATLKVSRASATQRAGRAGRTREGRVLRLYTRGDFEARPEHDPPEVVRADLSEAVLALRRAGVRPSELAWLTQPPAASLASAEDLLLALGAISRDGELTPIGRRLTELPLHPRLARLVVEGERRGVASEAALLAALVGERDIRLSSRTSLGERGRGPDASGPSDLLELAERFSEAESVRFEPHRLRSFGLDARAVEAVDRARRQVARVVKNQVPAPASTDATDRALLAATLAGFPDRVARRRKRGEADLILANGRTARLSEQSVVHDALLLVAIDAEERPGRGSVVRRASAVDENVLFELAGDAIEARDDYEFVSATERVERVSSLRLGAVVLDETRSLAVPSPDTARTLLEAARAQPARFLRSEAALKLAARFRLLIEHFPEAGLDPEPERLLERGLFAAAEQANSFAEIEASDWLGLTLSSLSREQQRLFENEVPERLRLGNGRSVEVHYEPGKPPWIESRLQDFFGARKTPQILGGRIALTVHLLAPNQRAVQVTSDLDGFWERHYPSVRRELMRRYPRHAWPEDGRTATPPPPKPPRHSG